MGRRATAVPLPPGTRFVGAGPSASVRVVVWPTRDLVEESRGSLQRPPRGLTACYFFLAVFLAAFLAVFLAAFFAVFFAIVPPGRSGPAFMAATDVSQSVA